MLSGSLRSFKAFVGVLHPQTLMQVQSNSLMLSVAARPFSGVAVIDAFLNSLAVRHCVSI